MSFLLGWGGGGVRVGVGGKGGGLSVHTVKMKLAQCCLQRASQGRNLTDSHLAADAAADNCIALPGGHGL